MQLHTAIGLITFAVLTSGLACPTLAQNPPSDRQLEALGLENRWEGQASLNVSRDVVSHITNDEENVYVQSSAGFVTALHAENGRRLWSRQVGRNDNPSMAAISNSKLVVIASGPDVIGLDKFTGAVVFNHRLTAQPTSIPAVDEKRLYVPVVGGAVYVYSIKTLTYLTRYKALPPDAARAHMYKFVCGEEIIHAPIIGEKAMAFVSEAGSFYSVETEGQSPGGTRFQLLMSGAPSNDLAVSDGDNGPVAIVLTGDQQVHQIDMTTGTTEWAFPMGRHMTQGPMAVGSAVYVVTRDRVVTKLNRDGRIGPLGRPTAIPNYQSPNVIGAGLKEVDVPDEAQQLVNIQSTTGVEVTEVAEGSPADRAGLLIGDIVVVVDGIETSSTDAAIGIFAELPLRAPRQMLVLRGGKLETLKIRINVREWEASGIKTLLAIGRFAVYGYDGSGRIVAVDRKKGELIGATDPTGFSNTVLNSKTDQIYLATSRGRVVCIREIGPIVTAPEVSTLTKRMRVRKVMVGLGDRIESVGTTLCELEPMPLPIQDMADGAGNTQADADDDNPFADNNATDDPIEAVPANTVPLVSKHAGIVQRIMVREGDIIEAGAPILRIADDQFATYHQKPQQRPVEVDLGNEAPAAAVNGQ